MHRAAGLLPILALAGCAAPGAAQTTFATITGIATDPSGTPVPGVAITVIHAASNYQYTATSNAAGYFSLAQLREGEYELKARLAGFQEHVARGIRLAAQDIRRIDIQLQVGTVETRVEVTAGPTLIETETARISDTRTADEFKQLPLNTRGLFDFLALTPGVTPSGTTAQRRYAGSRINQSDATLDGISFSDFNGGNQISPLAGYVESFQEVRTDMANNSAEFGAVGNITVISKSGANAFHGSVFDYYSTPGFRARNPFSPTRQSGIRHQPGWSVGGPVVLPRLYDGRNRTFFFHSFETSRGSLTEQLLNPTVPPASWREGNFSGVAGAVRDPQGNTPFPGNRIPSARANAVSRAIQQRFYPLPNTGDPNVLLPQNYIEVKRRGFDPNTYWTLRGDHRFSERSSVFARYTYNRSIGRPFNANLPTMGIMSNTRDTRAVVVANTFAVRPNLLNELRWGYSSNDTPRQSEINGRQLVSELGLTGLAPNLPDIPGEFRVSFAGVGITPIASSDVYRSPGANTFAQQIQNHVSWFRGRHSVKAGVMFSRIQYKDYQAPAALFGSATFSNRFTGHPYADFLLGIPTTSARGFPPIPVDRLRWMYDFFVTDEFRLSQRLTLTLGLRYEFRLPWNDGGQALSVFDIESGRIVVPDGALSKVSPLLPRAYVDVIEARQTVFDGTRLLRTDRNNLAPRIGLAWRPFGRDTVFRAGYGIFYDVVPGTPTNAGIPFQIAEPAFNNPTPAQIVLPVVYPSASGSVSSVSLPGAYRPDLRMPFSMQYSATVEHQRWETGFRLSYIGTNTRQGQWAYNINQPEPDTRPFVDKPRRFPTYPAINYITNGAGHQYHSFTAEAERRFARGWMHQFSWVWARDIGDLDRAERPENAYDRRRERAVSLDIPTHRVSAAFLWDLPLGNPAGRAARALVKGWQLSGIFLAYSGQFLTPLWIGADPTGTAFSQNRSPAQVTIRPDHLRDANLPGDNRTVQRWFDAAAFAPPQAGRFGTSAKGVIKGPGSAAVHAGIAKETRLFESVTLRWDLVASNAFNHPNWNNPGLTINQQAQVGVINGVGGVSGLDEAGPRSLRMGLRLEW